MMRSRINQLFIQRVSVGGNLFKNFNVNVGGNISFEKNHFFQRRYFNSTPTTLLNNNNNNNNVNEDMTAVSFDHIPKPIETINTELETIRGTYPVSWDIYSHRNQGQMDFGEGLKDKNDLLKFGELNNAFAVVHIGGKQYKITSGDVILTEKLEVEVGDEIVLDKVLLAGTESYTLLGKPLVLQVKVHATVEQHSKSEKVYAFKKRRRKHSQRTKGHRQNMTTLRIDSIVLHENVPTIPLNDTQALKEEFEKEDELVNEFSISL